MSKKIILIIIVVAVGIGFGVYQGFIKKEAQDFVLEKVSRGAVVQEVSETGAVKATKEIDLSFQNPGRIEKIYVKVDQEVKAGQGLVKLDTGQLEIQFTEAHAILEMAKANLKQLMAGASQEEIKLAETAVVIAERALFNARQNLEDVKAKADSSLDQAYEDGLIILDTAYLKLFNAFNTVSVIQRTYFTRADQEGIRVRENKEKIESALNNVKPFLQTEAVDIALVEMKTALSATASALGVIRDICETPTYRNLISDSDKTSLDTERTNINTGLTNIVNNQQIIFSAKLTNDANINTAEAKVDSAEGQVQSAKDALAIKKAEVRQTDIDIHNAQIKQAQSRIDLLKKQLAEAILKSPIQGRVVKINKKVGETVQIAAPIISLISIDDFQIEVDIYEEDVVKVEIGSPADIALVAFPDKILKGNVISIDPTEKLIEGVVYYEVIIGFAEELSRQVKPSMTADVVIKTAFRENVLIISDDAVEQRDGKFIVQVFKNGLIEEREIQIGLKGEHDRVEVISGLKEGEEVVIK